MAMDASPMERSELFSVGWVVQSVGSGMDRHFKS